MSGSEILFLRPTSGLTKYFGTWTALFAVVGASLGTTQWLFVGFLQDLYPGINAGMTWGVGMGFMMVYTVMLTLLSMAMPRSAGIYQISARGFNPTTGIIAVWRGIIANPIIKMSEFYLFLIYLGSAFAQWGHVTANAALTAAGQALSLASPLVTIPLAIGLMAIFSLIGYLGPLFRIEPRIQMIGGLFATIGWLLAIGVLATTPPADLANRWNLVWGAGAYEEVITQSTALGYMPAVLGPEMAIQMTLMASIWPIALVWPYLVLHYGGEIADPAKNLILSQILGGLICAALLASGAALFQGVFGDFTTRYMFVWIQGGALTQTAFFGPGVSTFTAVLAANPFISGWILLAPVVVGLTATPLNMGWVTRGFFQASLDRMMPTAFGKLSKYHTPTYSILYYFLFGVPFAFVFADPALSGLVNVFTALVGLWGIEMIVHSLAALQLPYVKRSLYEGSIRKQPEIAGWPVLSLLGIIMLPTSLFVMAGFFQGVAFLSLISMCIQYGFSAAWFLFFAHRLKKKDIDVSTIYDSLPPE